MTKEMFLWHAKRGHGDCFFAMNQDAAKYRPCVEKILVNNYAFLSEDEYRSFYACELIKFYNDDSFFAQLMWRKLVKANFDNYFLVDYLINNLYFIFQRNKKIDFTDKIRAMLITRLKKENFTIGESKSIQSLLSLIIDSKMDIDYESIVKKHQHTYFHSNLDLSDIDYCYHLGLNKSKHNLTSNGSCDFYDFDSLKSFLKQDVTDKELYMVSKKIDSDCFDYLFELIVGNPTTNNIKTNILKMIYFSNIKINSNRLRSLLSIEKELNVEEKKLVYSILANVKTILKTEETNKMSDWLFIRLALNNYKEDYYQEIHKRVKRMHINYCDSDLWFEVESSLINYFKKKNIDARLLSDLRIFLKKGLSSLSRYRIALILKKYDKLTECEKSYLSYDANYSTRLLFK